MSTSTTTHRYLIPFLVGMMLLTGVCNTLLTKYQDMQCVRNCSPSSPGKRRNFEQPVWQTAQMFVGEMGCFLVMFGSWLYTRVAASVRSRSTGYVPAPTTDNPEEVEGLIPAHSSEDAEPAAKPLSPSHPERAPLEGWRILLLALPAICDIAGTTLMNVGLLFVAASIYQMTRGALVLFVGLFSVIFLGRRLSGSKWMALVIVVLGVAVVGLAGALEQKHTPLPGSDGTAGGQGARHAGDLVLRVMRRATQAGAAGGEEGSAPAPVAQTLVGILLIALAQIFTASQFVLEESIMHRYSMTPLATVAWEGTFGLLVTLAAMGVAHRAYGATERGRGGYFDAATGWREMTGQRAIWASSLLIMVSIGGFNFFGLSVTRTVSATSRSTIDTCRTLFIWVVSLGLGWESFKWLQVVGFAGLVYGTFLFNDIVSPPKIKAWWNRGRGEEELLPERPIEHS